jgi:UDP-glucose 4-epimerase
LVFERIDAVKSPLIFGGDFPTRDGTCVRDYVHVLDLAEAHLAALDHIDDLEHAHRVYNVGTGTGTTVREIIKTILVAANSDLQAEVVARRAGDPAELVAAANRIAQELGWTAQFGLGEIVRSAWNAHEHLTADRPI